MNAGNGHIPPSPHLLLSSVLSERPVKESVRCDVCDALIEGEPAGRGLLVWVRGDEFREEEPALCDACAPAITAAGGMMRAYEGDL